MMPIYVQTPLTTLLIIPDCKSPPASQQPSISLYYRQFLSNILTSRLYHNIPLTVRSHISLRRYANHLRSETMSHLRGPLGCTFRSEGHAFGRWSSHAFATISFGNLLPTTTTCLPTCDSRAGLHLKRGLAPSVLLSNGSPP